MDIDAFPRREKMLKLREDPVRFLALENPSVARKVKNELMDAIRSLDQMPQRYPFLQTQFVPPNKYHRMLVAE